MTATNATLFSTVPRRDYLRFWHHENFEPQRVARFLHLNKAEVAKVAGVAPASVRFDRKIPKDVFDRLVEIASICGLVAQFFEGNVTKTDLWFRTKNSMLGNISPRDMIRYGRYEKLRRFVMEALQENASHVSVVAGQQRGASATV